MTALTPIRIIAALVFALALSAGHRAEAATGCPLPFVLQNGAIPDATQVMANFYALQSCMGGGGGAPINLGLTVPPELTVTGSPYTGGSGVFAVGKAAENAGTVWAGPAAGTPQPPTFRQLACADLAGGCGTPASQFSCATTPGSCPFAIPMFWAGVPPNSQVVRISLADAATCPAGLSQSEGSAKEAATGTPVVGIYQIAGGVGTPTLVATATFTGATPAFAAASAINFSIGDVIQYQFPASADATLGDVSLTLHCNRTTGFTIGSTGAPLPNANIWVGNAMGVAQAVLPSGDLTVSNAGVFTITRVFGTVTSVGCGTGLTGGTFTTSGTCALDLTATNTWTGPQAFGEAHGTSETVTLTSNNYNAVVADCGKTKFLPTGTTPTVTLPNINPASGSCTITFVTTAAKSYLFNVAAGGSKQNTQGFYNTRGNFAGDTVSVILLTPSVSAAAWSVSGDLTS